MLSTPGAIIALSPVELNSTHASRLFHHLRRPRRLRQDDAAAPPRRLAHRPGPHRRHPPPARRNRSRRPHPRHPPRFKIRSRPRPHRTPRRARPHVRRPRPVHRRGHPPRPLRRLYRPLRPLHRLVRSLSNRRAGRQLGSDRVLALHAAVCDNLQPDLTLLLLPDLSSSLYRARRRNTRHAEQQGTDENRFEREGDAFYQRIHAAYEAIARREPERVATIRVDASISVVEALIREIVAERLSRAGA